MRKLAHVRALGYGLRIWDSPRYMIPGVSPSHSVYDVPDGFAHDTDFPRLHAGVYNAHERQPLTDPSANRQPRIGAQFSSFAALPIFQSAFATNWSHMTIRPNLDSTRALAVNNNRNAYGRAEMQRATSYNPWPSAGDIYPKAI